MGRVGAANFFTESVPSLADALGCFPLAIS